VVTEAGRNAHREFHETNVVRRSPHAPLMRYFDPAAYGLAIQPPRRDGAHGHWVEAGIE
jgi:hypothetical protein